MEEYRDSLQVTTEEKVVKPVIKGSAKVRERSKVQKFADVFISEDIGNVRSYILRDVLIPGLKNILYDILTKGLSMTLFGDAKATGIGQRQQTVASKVSYRDYYDQPKKSPDRNSGTNSSGYDFENLLFESKFDAEEVLDGMNDIIDRYGIVSIADLYDLANVQTDNFALNKYGWASIQGCKAVPVNGGYILRLPRAVPINSIN